MDGVLQDSPRRGEPRSYLISSTNRTLSLLRPACLPWLESPFFEFHTMAHNRITTHIHTHARAPISLDDVPVRCAVDLDDRTAGQTPTHGGSGCDSLRWGWLVAARWTRVRFDSLGLNPPGWRAWGSGKGAGGQTRQISIILMGP
jgi:hypothetical protein